MPPVDTLLLASGFLAGGLGALFAWRGRRGVRGALVWGLLPASLAWVARSAWLSNHTDGMGGIPHAIVAGILFWFVTVPTAAVLIRDRIRRNRPTASS
jgi:Na+-translocating ferredoxin:NAD+ oxidoreductase RnfD subunit